MSIIEIKARYFLPETISNDVYFLLLSPESETVLAWNSFLINFFWVKEEWISIPIICMWICDLFRSSHFQVFLNFSVLYILQKDLYTISMWWHVCLCQKKKIDIKRLAEYFTAHFCLYIKLWHWCHFTLAPFCCTVSIIWPHPFPLASVCCQISPLEPGLLWERYELSNIYI